MMVLLVIFVVALFVIALMNLAVSVQVRHIVKHEQPIHIADLLADITDVSLRVEKADKDLRSAT